MEKALEKSHIEMASSDVPVDNGTISAISGSWCERIEAVLDDSVLFLLKSYFPSIDVSNTKILARLSKCNPKLFEKNILEVISEFEIPNNSKDPLGWLLSCNNLVDDILLIDLRLLDLLKNRFWVNWNMLRELVGRKKKHKGNNNYDESIYLRLLEIIDKIDKYCWNRWYRWKYTFKISDVLNLLDKKNDLELLFFIDNMYGSNKLSELEAVCRNELGEIGNSFSWKPYNSPSYSKQNINKRVIYEQKTLASCNTFFGEWVTEDNFVKIFENYFNIVFDGKYNDFLQEIPMCVVKRADFLEKIVVLSSESHAMYKIFPLIEHLYNFWQQTDNINVSFKIEILSALECVSNLMSAAWAFWSFVYWLMSLWGDHSLEFFRYILSKHWNMKACDKVKLLPYFSDIPFESWDSLDEFINSIISEFWIHCLRPYYSSIVKKYKKLGVDYVNWGYSFKSESEKYFTHCLCNLLLPDTDISTIYSSWSWEFMSRGWIIGVQKFIFWGDVLDSQNINFWISTDRVDYHKYLEFKWKRLWWWVLYKDDSNKIIHVYGRSMDFWSVYAKFYPVIADIIWREYPGYEVGFWDPTYIYD